LLAKLKRKYGSSCKGLEAEHIDILVELDNKFVLYEIKTHISVVYCIREALGQLMHYAMNLSRFSKPLEFVIVGPSALDDNGRLLIEFIRKNMKIPLNYERFII
jgi:hypothetical protein